MKNIVKVLVFVLPLGMCLQFCKKDKKMEPVPEPENPKVTPVVTSPGGLKIQFNTTVDSDSLVLGKTYVNANGDAFTVSKFNYYISNIVLTKNDNSLVTINNFYQIIKQSDIVSRTINLTGIPEGSYKALKLMLGVDSARNRSGAQTGGLDVAYASDMYWSWNQGYIFLKLEGASPAAPSTNEISYHIGGYGGAYKTQREFVFNFVVEQLTVAASKTPTLNLLVNVNELFKNPTQVSFALNPTITSPGTKDAKMIADNYADMIKFGSLKN